jgi:hypothetical protein
MEVTSTKKKLLRSVLLIGIFLIVATLAGVCRTPGSWSDIRSQWFPDLLILPTAFALCIAVHWIYRKDGVFSKIQAACLWLLFGAALIGCMVNLIRSQEFLAGLGYSGPFDYLQHPSRFMVRPWGNF